MVYDDDEDDDDEDDDHDDCDDVCDDDDNNVMEEALDALQDSESNGDLPPVADSDAPASVEGSDSDHNPAGFSDGWG